MSHRSAWKLLWSSLEPNCHFGKLNAFVGRNCSVGKCVSAILNSVTSICACIARYVEYVVSFPVLMRVVNESSVRSAVIIAEHWSAGRRTCRTCSYGSCKKPNTASYVAITCIFLFYYNIYVNNIQYNTIKIHNTIRYNTIIYNTIQLKYTIQYHNIQYNQYNTIKLNTIQYITIIYKTIQLKYNTIKYKTIP